MLTISSVPADALTGWTAMMKAIASGTKNLFIVNQWPQIGNQTLDLAQILATPLLRSQSSLAHHDGEIADTMQLFAVQFLSRCVMIERGGRQDQVVFQSLRIDPCGGAQFAT